MKPSAFFLVSLYKFSVLLKAASPAVKYNRHTVLELILLAMLWLGDKVSKGRLTRMSEQGTSLIKFKKTSC